MTSSNSKHTSTSEQRQHYRISSGLNSLLDVTLVLADDKQLPAYLVDVSAGGACLAWSPDETPVLDIGQEVELRFKTKSTKKSFGISSTVRWVNVEESTIRYGFQFQELGDLFDRIDPTLWGFFNRRKSPRG